MRTITGRLVAASAALAVLVGPWAVGASSAATRTTSSQWAVSATATSQYGTDSWAAKQATGAPNVTACGDDGRAWASENSDGYDKLQVRFAKAVVPTMVNIHVSYNPGQVTMVQVIDTAGTATVIYKKAPKAISTCPYVMSIPVTGVTNPVNRVRITVNQSRLDLGWTEIDAVQLVGNS